MSKFSALRPRLLWRWLGATVLVFALGAALVTYGLSYTRSATQAQYGEPVDVPPGQVALACPAVPQTVNPNAVDVEGKPLPTPRIAGSVTAVVMARSGKAPDQATYVPFGPDGSAVAVSSVEDPDAASSQGSASGQTQATTENPDSAANSQQTASTPEPNPNNATAARTSTGRTSTGPTSTGPTSTQNPNATSLEFTPRSAMLVAQADTPRPGIFTAEPWGGKAALAAADIEQSVSSGDFRGLATATCVPASQESWLVGGSTAPGQSTTLQVVNLSSNAVSANIDIWGDTGKLEFPRGTKLVVSPRSTVSIPLESQVQGNQRLVTRVKANGAGLAAFLQTHSLLGLTPGGVSLVHPSTRAAQVQVVPGVALNADLGAVRLLNTGEDVARASISVVGEGGSTAVAGAQEVELDPGAVFDFTLGGVPEGNYSVVVNSNQPVVAGAVIYRQGSESKTEKGKFSRDLAWLPALSAGGGVVIGPAAVERQLMVTNLSGQAAEFRIGGEAHSVAPNTTVVLPLTAETPLQIEAPNLYVTQILTTNLGDGLGIDSLEPTPDLDAARQVYVHLNS